jgi:hypothetical protein
MKCFVRRLAIAAIVVFGRVALAGADPAPDTRTAEPGQAVAEPQAANRPAPADGSSRSTAATEDSSKATKWRYRWHNGRWWYWTTKNNWLYWSDPQGWVAFQPPVAQPPVAQPPVAQPPVAQPPVTRPPGGDQWRWGWDPANPFDRHPPGRPLNSPKTFPRNM